jgi:hypothetical protein
LKPKKSEKGFPPVVWGWSFGVIHDGLESDQTQ